MKKLIASLIFLNVLAFSFAVYFSLPRYLEINYFDVGQGDSIFIQTPGNHQILIDGGPDNIKAVEAISSEMPFWDKTIDLVILTHAESDHLTGLFEVLDSYKVENILWTGVEKDSDKFRDWERLLDKEIAEDGAKEYIAKSSDKILVGDVTIEIIYPMESLEGQTLKDVNDTSIVSRLSFNDSSFLFPGDISSKVESVLNGDISADVLKVAHHGSKYSTSDEFLQRVDPKLAIIQVGKNSYGHPTEEVLTRLRNYDIKILRNDTNGNIKVVSDGKDYKIITNK